jgi:hypothetical protein
MAELHVGIFRRDAQHVGVEIAERGEEDQVGAVEIDHALHRLFDGRGLGDFFFLKIFDVRLALAQRGDGLRVRLVEAEIVLWADIDEADRRRVGAGGRGADQRGAQRHRCALQNLTTRQIRNA